MIWDTMRQPVVVIPRELVSTPQDYVVDLSGIQIAKCQITCTVRKIDMQFRISVVRKRQGTIHNSNATSLPTSEPQTHLPVHTAGKST